MGLNEIVCQKALLSAWQLTDNEQPLFSTVIKAGSGGGDHSGPHSSLSKSRDLLSLWAASGPQEAGSSVGELPASPTFYLNGEIGVGFIWGRLCAS